MHTFLARSMDAKNAVLNASMEKLGYANYTTCAMHSTDKTSYGYFEIRSKTGSGQVSSSWWFHDNNGTEWTEIDVFESTGVMAPTPFPHMYNTHTHIFYIDGMTGSQIEAECNCTVHQQGTSYPCSAGQTYTLPFNMSDDFHIYGLDWTAESLLFYVDSKVGT